jgi:hypothetical protein
MMTPECDLGEKLSGRLSGCPVTVFLTSFKVIASDVDK